MCVNLSSGWKPEGLSALFKAVTVRRIFFLNKLAEFHCLPPRLKAGWASYSAKFGFKRHCKRETWPQCLESLGTRSFSYFLPNALKHLISCLHCQLTKQVTEIFAGRFFWIIIFIVGVVKAFTFNTILPSCFAEKFLKPSCSRRPLFKNTIGWRQILI